MTPRLSPNKTWAGLLGGIIAGTLTGLLLVLLLRAAGLLAVDTPLWQGMVMGFVVSTLTPTGDLFISLFKRTAGVKDTGNLIPGHGGILDRIDTWIWAGMLGYYLVLVFNY
jgi:phosphatidate cytidylyltransferase